MAEFIRRPGSELEQVAALQLSPTRRSLLMTTALVCAASSFPRAWAASTDSQSREAFEAVSLFLTGRATLENSQSARLFDAMAKTVPDFSGRIQELARYVAQKRPDPLALQKELDQTMPHIADLPRAVATAWYLGVVGDAEKARCVSFETNLTNRLVADKLRPPSYSFGPYGSWTAKPA